MKFHSILSFHLNLYIDKVFVPPVWEHTMLYMLLPVSQMENPDLDIISFFTITLWGAMRWAKQRETLPLYGCVPFLLNHYGSYLVPASRSLLSEWCHLWHGWNGPKSAKNTTTSASFQHIAIISILLPISIAKGLIMLMKHPSGLVLSVGGHSCRSGR